MRANFGSPALPLGVVDKYHITMQANDTDCVNTSSLCCKRLKLNARRMDPPKRIKIENRLESESYKFK